MGFKIARALNTRLDVLVCRKLLIPGNREAGFGAMVSDGTYFYDESLARYLGLGGKEIEDAIEEQRREISRRLSVYRCSEPYGALSSLRVAVVDDGIAAGYTVIATARFLRRLGAKRVEVYVPTCCTEAVRRVAREVDAVYCYNAL